MQNNSNPNDMFGNSQGVEQQINPLEYPAVECSSCGCKIFIPALMFYKIPGSLYGRAGQTINQPMKVFVCRNCGALSPDDQDIYDDLKMKAEAKLSTSSN